MIAAFKRKPVNHGLQNRIAGIAAKGHRMAAAAAAAEAEVEVDAETQVAAPPAVDATAAGVAEGAVAAASPAEEDESQVGEPSPEPAMTAARADPRQGPLAPGDLHLIAARDELVKQLATEISSERRAVLHRGDIAKLIDHAVARHFRRAGTPINAGMRRRLVTDVMQELASIAEARNAPVSTNGGINIAVVEAARERIHPRVIEQLDVTAAAGMPRPQFEAQLNGWVTDLLTEAKIQLNFVEHRKLVDLLVSDMLGLGPLDTLMADETVSDIMINGHKQIYVERRGKVELTDTKFRDEQHLMNICTRIVTRVGRRIDESRPWVDARLPDGSRVNIIIPPLAIDGISVSIRKFSKKSITLDSMAMNGSISLPMAKLLKIAARCRLNILISGGTGSGKTTLLNALSRLIDGAERTVTIEDAAELQLQQPHVVRLETRTANLEGGGEVTQRDLLKNALRMRPDRIIIGECRGEEALDMLQAMNTGHDGSMSTIHANNPREALGRLETMIGMASANLPAKALRTQIASAIDLICQVSRMRDGHRRVTHITEVVGMEGEIITTQDLFTYEFHGMGADGKLRGSFESAGIRPMFLPRAEYFGLDQVLLEAI